MRRNASVKDIVGYGLGKPPKSGTKTGDWVIQSKLTPIKPVNPGIGKHRKRIGGIKPVKPKVEFRAVAPFKFRAPTFEMPK